MTHSLSERTRRLIACLKDEKTQRQINMLFEINPVYVGDPVSESEVERARFSLIKCAMENEGSFSIAKHLYHADVRDLYLQAGFEQPEDHDRWCQKMLDSNN